MGPGITVASIRESKNQRKIAMLTAYDYPFAALFDRAGIDIILIGDSLANVVLGLENTVDVGMPEMLHHAKAVRRAVKQALVVADMPFCAYQKRPQEAVANAEQFTREAGADAVKVEWFSQCLDVVRNLRAAEIEVMGHIGLTPQTAESLGGFKVQGKDAQAAKALFEQAKALEKAGCFSLVLECVPEVVARRITEMVGIPTIGIGAGRACDGQVLVMHDVFGLSMRHVPKFVKKYVDLTPAITRAAEDFIQDVRAGRFPSEAHIYAMSPAEAGKLNAGHETKNP